MGLSGRGRGAWFRGAGFAVVVGLTVCVGARAQTPQPPPPLKTESLTVITHRGAARFIVEIADTDTAREYGLMFRKALAGEKGMLFDFQTPQPVSFWMKNTLIPLDIVFIGPDGRVLNIARHATPLSLTPISSAGAALGVLEIAGDRAAALDIEPGDLVRERIFPAQ